MRQIMWWIARSKGSRDLDTRRDYVYTDMAAVRRFAAEFLASFAPAEERIA